MMPMMPMMLMMLMSLKELALLLLVFLIGAHNSIAQTGCEVCASTGDCSRAYLQQPGKYCGTFQQYVSTTKPCCCPNYSQCQLSSTSCNCYVPPHHSGSNSYDSGYHRGYNNYNDDDYYDSGVGGILVLMILICICCCCCAGLCNSDQRSNRPSGEFVPIAVPVNGQDPEGNPPATAPSYQASTPGWGGGGVRSSSGSGGGFSWAPALGGFIIGEMLGRSEGGNRNHHHRHHRHGGGGWGGGGGGFTIPGDTGGGGRGGGGGFTIPGSS